MELAEPFMNMLETDHELPHAKRLPAFFTIAKTYRTKEWFAREVDPKRLYRIGVCKAIHERGISSQGSCYKPTITPSMISGE